MIENYVIKLPMRNRVQAFVQICLATAFKSESGDLLRTACSQRWIRHRGGCIESTNVS